MSRECRICGSFHVNREFKKTRARQSSKGKRRLKNGFIFYLRISRYSKVIFLCFLGPVHTYPDIFESGTFFFRIRLPSTRIRRRHFGTEEPWVLEWIRIPSDTCVRGNFFIRKEKVADSKIRVDGALTLTLTLTLTLKPRPHVSGYLRIRNFFFPDTATVHMYPANLTANPEKNKSALHSGKNISVTNPITCGRVDPDFFIRWRKKRVQSLTEQ